MFLSVTVVYSLKTWFSVTIRGAPFAKKAMPSGAVALTGTKNPPLSGSFVCSSFPVKIYSRMIILYFISIF